MHSIASVVIDRPIEEVFYYTNDHVADWCMSVAENEVIEDKDGVGTTFRCVTEGRTRPMVFQGTVTVWEPPYRSAVNLVSEHVDIEAEYRFDDLDGRTRVTQASAVAGKGFAKVAFLLFGWLMDKQGNKAVQRELDNLKRKLEAGAAQTAN